MRLNLVSLLAAPLPGGAAAAAKSPADGYTIFLGSIVTHSPSWFLLLSALASSRGDHRE
jgi:hypothetical protein